MHENPSEATPDDSEVASASESVLERWAFGRASSAAERARAAAALTELDRRAAVARAAAERAHVADADSLGAETDSLGTIGDGAAESEHPGSEDDTARRRRMLRTGLAGVLAAALAVPVVVTQLTLPDPDPIAIFERPATAEDLAVIEPLTRIFGDSLTLGPRIAYSTDRGMAAVFRASTVPDGKSTDWDSYCVVWLTFTSNGELSGSTGQCVAPPRFDQGGVTIDIGSPIAGESAKAVQWGPAGSPVIVTQSEAGEGTASQSTPLDLLAFPRADATGSASLEGIGDSSRLLMGPTTVLTTGNDDEQLDISLFLQRSRVTEGGDPLLCVRGYVTYAPAAIGCRPLDAALSDGLTLYVPSREGGWFVEVSPDGAVSANMIDGTTSVSTGG